MSLEFRPVAAERMEELDRFAGKPSRFRWCWCMAWRLRSSEFARTEKAEREVLFKARVEAGEPVGVLAFEDGEPIGWCSVAPRETYAALERYRNLPRVDDEPVWSVACFVVLAKARRRGLTEGLLRAATAYAHEAGARIVEGYPVDPGDRMHTWMGSPRTFERAGFTDVTPKGQARRVMRHVRA